MLHVVNPDILETSDSHAALLTKGNLEKWEMEAEHADAG